LSTDRKGKNTTPATLTLRLLHTTRRLTADQNESRKMANYNGCECTFMNKSTLWPTSYIMDLQTQMALI